MKKKTGNKLLSLAVAAAMTVGMPAAVYAAEGTAVAEQTEEKTEEAGTKQTQEEIKVALEQGELIIVNQTTRVFQKAELVKAEDKEEKKETSKKTEEADHTKEQKNLMITEENGETHTYEHVSLEQAKEAVIYDKYGFLYVKYQDENGKDQEAAETAEEKKLDEPLTMYASSNVHMRKEADAKSESLQVIQMGTECKVVSMIPGWMIVEDGSQIGYVSHSYLTEDKESVEAALKAKAEAEAAAAAQAQAEAEAAAAAAAQAAAQAEAEAQAQQQTQEVYEVSRVAYDDCDGSGHGYYEITYSDGSVKYEEY